jgi:hypothetical protein
VEAIKVAKIIPDNSMPRALGLCVGQIVKFTDDKVSEIVEARWHNAKKVTHGQHATVQV